MRPHVHTIVLTSEIGEVGEFAEDARLALLDIQSSADSAAPVGECTPAVDVAERDEAIEITVDLPGVGPESIRVVIKGNGVLIVGEKTPRRRWAGASFHLVERGFGRFARLVRLTAPCDTGAATATLVEGELRVRLPKRPDRRGRPFPVPVTRAERSA